MPKKQKRKLELLRTEALAPAKYLLTLALDAELAGACRPGQFFNLLPLDSTAPLLRRPISICDVRVDAGEMDLLIQDVGEGTHLLCERRPGALIDVVGPLGRAFDVDAIRPAVLVAGGVGVAPLYYLAAWMRRNLPSSASAPAIAFCYGARKAEDLVLLDRIEKVSSDLVLTTEDGSIGEKGFVTAFAQPYLVPGTQIFVCGPSPMMNAALGILRRIGLRGQFSLENQMGCGVGACQGCVVPGRHGSIRVCCDGPVVDSEQLDYILKET